MKDNVKWMTEMEELISKAEMRYHITKAAMKSDRERLKIMYDWFSSSSESLSRVMRKDLDKMKIALRTAAKNNDPPTVYNLLDNLQACFDEAASISHRMGAAKEGLLNGAYDILKGYMTAKRDETLQVRKVLTNRTLFIPVEKFDGFIPKLDTSLVTVTSVSDPGKFYVVHNNDMEKRDRLSAELQWIAPNCSAVADIIVPDQVYAVLNNRNQWARATVELHFDMFQVEEEPSEILYDCFLLDYGHYELIPKSNLRVLPEDLMGIPPFAKECTLNDKFICHHWSPESIVLFKDWALSSPIEMKVLARKRGVFHVDLYRQEENYGTVSVTDSLAIARQLPFVPRTLALSSIRKFKPKYSLEDLNSNPIKHASVIIIRACQPGEIYVQIDDDELPLYYQMQRDLKNEFRYASKSSASYCSSPIPGNVYVLKFNGEFHRILIEKYENRKTKVFFVDLGNRFVLNRNMEIHNIPDRFMELPAQAIRCHLHAVQPGKNLIGNWNKHLKEMFQFMKRYDGQRAVASVASWSGSDVGFVLYPNSTIPLTTELKAFAILCPNEYSDSINQQVCQKMGYVPGIIRLISEDAVRERPTNIQHESRISISSNAIDSSSPRSTTESKLSFCSLFKPTWKSFDLPEIGDSFTARVTWFNEEGGIFLQDVGSKMQLDFIRQQLYEKYEGTRPAGMDLCCSVGDLCIAKFKEEWYRGTVQAIGIEEVEIYFTDFGMVGVVDINSVRLDIALEEIPAQALRCSLFNLKPAFEQHGWSVTEQEEIFKEASKCDYRVIVKDPGPPTQVELVYLSPIYRSLNRELVAKQLADFIK